MAVISIPSLQQVRDNVNADIKSRVSQTLRPELPTTTIGVLAQTIAASEYAGMLAIQRAADASFLSSAQGDALAELAAPFGVQRRAGTPAQGVARFTYSANLPFGASSANFRVNLTDDEGNQYFADVPGYFFDGSRTHLLQNVQTVSVGTSANIDAGTRFNFVSLTGITSPTQRAAFTGFYTNNLVSIVADTPFTGGSGAENDDELRARFLQTLRTPTAGGTVQEWENWTREVSGVTRVFVRRLTPGSVDVYPVFDANVNNLPSTPNLNTVNTHLQTYRPASVELRVLAFTPKIVNITFRVAPFTTEIVQATEKALDDAVIAYGRLGETFEFQRLWQALSSVPNVDRFELVTPTANTPLESTELFIPNISNQAFP